MDKPIVVDLFCGLGGWTEGFLAEDYEAVGFDIERHDYGTGGYPGWLILQDILTLSGHQFRSFADRLRVIVASPPCQKYSYMAMPWKRAKALAAWYRQDLARQVELNALFNACFRIQREASQVCGRHIPLIVENVRRAQPWVGRSAWNFGSYHLWGDVPALMPITQHRKQPGRNFHFPEKYGIPSPSFHGHDGESSVKEAIKISGQDWSRFAKTGEVSPHWRMEGLKTVEHLNIRDGHSHTRHLTNPDEHARGCKGFTPHGEPLGKNTLGRAFFSKDPRRKAASAAIAKIPFPLARHIAKCFKEVVSFTA